MNIISRLLLLKDLNSLIIKGRQLNEQLGRKKREFSELKKEFQPEIDNLVKRADALAAEFRQLYQEATELYNAGEKSSAKEISKKARGVQKVCEDKNRIANEMKKCLNDLSIEVGSLRRQIEKNEKEILFLSNKG